MGSFVEAIRGRLPFANREKKQQGLTEDQVRRYVAQYTDEPFDVVNQRFNKRFADPQVKSHLADAFSAFIQTYEERDPDPELLYKSTIDCMSAILFGVNYQEVDLNTFIEPNEKDSERINKLRDVRDALSDYNLGNAKELLAGIPLPKGSECDEGLYNDYSHEVLFATVIAACGLSAALDQIANPTENESLSAHDLAQSAHTIVNGILLTDRSVIMNEMIGLAPNLLLLQELKYK